jgi:hypothetical protein
MGSVSSELEYRSRYIGARVDEDRDIADALLTAAKIPDKVPDFFACGGPCAESFWKRFDAARMLRGADADQAIVAACTKAAEADPYGPGGTLALAVLEAMTTEWGHHPDKPFTPDWTLRPGVILVAEAIKARNWTPEDLAERSGLDPATARGLLDGSAPARRCG